MCYPPPLVIFLSWAGLRFFFFLSRFSRYEFLSSSCCLSAISLIFTLFRLPVLVCCSSLLQCNYPKLNALLAGWFSIIFFIHISQTSNVLHFTPQFLLIGNVELISGHFWLLYFLLQSFYFFPCLFILFFYILPSFIHPFLCFLLFAFFYYFNSSFQFFSFIFLS